MLSCYTCSSCFTFEVWYDTEVVPTLSWPCLSFLSAGPAGRSTRESAGLSLMPKRWNGNHEVAGSSGCMDPSCNWYFSPKTDVKSSFCDSILLGGNSTPNFANGTRRCGALWRCCALPEAVIGWSGYLKIIIPALHMQNLDKGNPLMTWHVQVKITISLTQTVRY